MPSFSTPIIATFLCSLLCQIVAVALLPVTRGFTSLWPTLGCIVAFVLGIAASARLIQGGVNLSILTPLTTVALQLSVLIVAITIYGESASWAKVGLLVGSAVMIGLATRL